MRQQNIELICMLKGGQNKRRGLVEDSGAPRIILVRTILKRILPRYFEGGVGISAKPSASASSCVRIGRRRMNVGKSSDV